MTVVILSDTDAATHRFIMSPAAALSMAELICGYRRMLEAYVPMSKTFEYPIRPKIPHPALFAKPVKRKVLAFQNSRAELVRNAYLQLCRERGIAFHPPLVRKLDQCVDNGVNIGKLDLAGLRWGKARLSLVLDALVAARTYEYVENEDFIENMSLDMLDFGGNNVLEKGFFGELVVYFEKTLCKHPYELRGVGFRGCQLNDRAVAALQPALVKLKKLERADFSKNPLKPEGVKTVLLAMRDACASFQELNLGATGVGDKATMGLVAAMLDKNSQLTRLDLSNSGVTDMGVLLLLKGLMNHPRIRALNMSGNKLGSSKCSSDLFIWASRTKSLEELHMASTGMPSKSSKAVAKVLEDPACVLKCVDISGNDFGAKGFGIIMAGLAQNSVLEHVYLDGLPVSEKNYENLCRFIRKACNKLVHLSLRGTPLGKKGLHHVLVELAECQKLRSINIGGGPVFTQPTSAALVGLLTKTKTLETLILSGSTFDRDTWAGVCKAIKSSHSLRRVELDDVNMNKLPFLELRDALQQVPTVREITFRRCNLGAEALLSFLNVINAGSNSGLRMLDARGNKDLILVPNHKKFGPILQEKLGQVYLKLRIDPSGKK